MLRRILRRLLPEWLVSPYRWGRRLHGGKWERWWVDVVYADVWHRVPEWSEVTGSRPAPICHGPPVCEDWSDGLLTLCDDGTGRLAIVEAGGLSLDTAHGEEVG